MELALDYATDTSVRNSTKRLNRIRLEEKGIIPTTYRNIVEREGEKIQKHIEETCNKALEQNGFNNDGTRSEESRQLSKPAKHIAQAKIESAAIDLGIMKYSASDYEEPAETVNISIDDVCVKEQTEVRPNPCPKEERTQKKVNNSVAHIQFRKKTYILNAASVMNVLKLVIGVLLVNGLAGKQIVVFADGARTIHSIVLKMLSFANVKLILDWYHLQKKCKEELSRAFKNRKYRNEFLEKLLPCLWYGNVDKAILLLTKIDKNNLKNESVITKLIESIEYNRKHIPCYALRKELGLRNSSNMGEKANDLVVSNRQKHNGMSWSNAGSLAFATVASASCNAELRSWLAEGSIRLSLKVAA